MRLSKIIAFIFLIIVSKESVAQVSSSMRSSKDDTKSAKLVYHVNDSNRLIFFYNELVVPKGADLAASKYIACGFANGQFALQVNDKKQKVVTFSVFHPKGDKESNQNDVSAITHGENVSIVRSGKNKSAQEARWQFNWLADSSYQFLITALPDSASNSSKYSAYFFAPEKKAWKYISTFKVSNDTSFLEQPYSSVQSLQSGSTVQTLKSVVQNTWLRDEYNNWIKPVKTTLAHNWTSGNTIDAGTKTNGFYLTVGRSIQSAGNNNQILTIDSVGGRPAVNLFHHVDSLLQAKKELSIMQKAVKDGRIDTTGSIEKVWYKIMKEGTGPQVKISDTVTVFYKGYVLDGPEFDSTDKEPRTFPLNRLIKGFQLGLTQSKVGGKVKMIIPSGLAYSIRDRAPNIPPNSILVFEIETVAVSPKK